MQADLQPDFVKPRLVETLALCSRFPGRYLLFMARESPTSVLRNGLPLHGIAMDGTRAVTLMVTPV